MDRSLVVKNSKISPPNMGSSTSPPYHYQSNGKVESAVKPAKKILQACLASGANAYLALLVVRNTPQVIHKTSPAQRLFNCRTKTPLPTVEKLLQPAINSKAMEDLQKKKYDKRARELSPLRKGEMVKMQPTIEGKRIWKRGKVIRKVGIRSYEIESNGRKYTRNGKFLRRLTTATEENGYSTEEESLTSERDDNVDEEVNIPESAELIPECLETKATSTIGTRIAVRATTSSNYTTGSGRLIKKPNRLGL